MRFKRQLSDLEIELLECRITEHFAGKNLITNKGIKVAFSFNSLDRILGLVYTSSSNYGMLSICNVELEHSKGYKYNHFAIGEDGKYYAILWDNEENEKIIEI